MVALWYFAPQITALLGINASPCKEPTLVFGASRFSIKIITSAEDGSFSVPADTADVAYWIKGNGSSFVFALSPTAANLALEKTFKAGDLVSIFDSDCIATSFTLGDPEAGLSRPPDLQAQPATGFVLFIQNPPAGEGFAVRGEPVPVQIISTDTPAPEGPGIQAEISLLKTSTSADKQSIQIKVSIYNYSSSAFTLSPNDVQLTPENSNTISLSSSNPALPYQVEPGAKKEFSFTFTRPASPTATLKIFDVEYDIEGY